MRLCKNMFCDKTNLVKNNPTKSTLRYNHSIRDLALSERHNKREDEHKSMSDEAI